jgi:hypothetical protein
MPALILRKSLKICFTVSYEATHVLPDAMSNNRYIPGCNVKWDRFCGLVVRVLGYSSGGPGSIPDTTKKKRKWVWNGVHSAS